MASALALPGLTLVSALASLAAKGVRRRRRRAGAGPGDNSANAHEDEAPSEGASTPSASRRGSVDYAEAPVRDLPVCGFCLSHHYESAWGAPRVHPLAPALRFLKAFVLGDLARAPVAPSTVESNNPQRIDCIRGRAQEGRLVRPCKCKTPVHVGCLHRWRWQKWQQFGILERRCRVCCCAYDMRVCSAKGEPAQSLSAAKRAQRVVGISVRVLVLAFGARTACALANRPSRLAITTNNPRRRFDIMDLTTQQLIVSNNHHNAINQ